MVSDKCIDLLEIISQEVIPHMEGWDNFFGVMTVMKYDKEEQETSIFLCPDDDLRTLLINLFHFIPQGVVPEYVKSRFYTARNPLFHCGMNILVVMK